VAAAISVEWRAEGRGSGAPLPRLFPFLTVKNLGWSLVRKRAGRLRMLKVAV